MKEYEAILRLFKSVLLDEVTENYTKLIVPSERALKEGVLIDEGFSAEIIDEAIKQYGRNGEEANQTFHKSLFKVANESLVQLYYEQLLHYFTTYGAEALGVYDADCVIVPRERLNVPELQTDTMLIVISPITADELKERIYTMITSGIALSKQTVQDIVALSDYIDIHDYSDGDNYFCKVTNKEVKTALCGKLGILPKRGDEFLRYFLAKICDRTLLIKDEETERSIALRDEKEILELLQKYEKQYGLIPLAKVYNRFKPLFLSMKRQPKEALKNYYSKEDLETMKTLNNLINRIMRLSKEYHKPMPEDDLNHFLNWVNSIGERPDFSTLFKTKLEEAGVFGAVKIYNYLNQLYWDESSYRVYKIRNGKVFIKDGYKKPYLSRFYVELAKEVVVDFIRKNVEGKSFYIPESVDYKIPQSEKKYVGNIPFGTRLTFDKQPILIGIHWCNFKDKRGEHRTDLDLRLVSNEYNIGWNSSYREGDELLFTGDNTNAPLPKGASEFIYIDNEVKDTVFSMKVNNYTTDVGPIGYEIIIGTADKSDVAKKGRDFIIDPNNILARIPMEMEIGKSDQTVGVINVVDDKIELIFTDLTTSNLRVSGNTEIEKKVREYTLNQEESQARLSSVLIEAGATRTKTNKVYVEEPYILGAKGKLVSKKDADKEGLKYTEEDILYKKVAVPVDLDFSLDGLTKDSFIRLFSEGE